MTTPAEPSAGLTVTELIAGFMRYADGYYRKDGNPTREIASYKESFRPLKSAYGTTAAASFGPLALKSLRAVMVANGWSRNTINGRVSRIKRLFAWGVEEEIVPPAVDHALRAVRGLKRGRSEARETEPIKPVPDAFVEATLPHVTPQVAAMIRLQMLTGMRSGEVVIMRTRDLDMTGPVWVYTPSSHKTQHHGVVRQIVIGPHAQEIVRPFLTHDIEAFLFSPIEADADHRADLRRRRKSPVQPSQRNRPKRRRRHALGDCYTVASYRRAIARAADVADKRARGLGPPFLCDHCKREYTLFAALVRHARSLHGVAITPKEDKGPRAIPAWHPHQLRHAYASRVRREFGLEAAQVALGHQSADITQVYAERNLALAGQVAQKIG